MKQQRPSGKHSKKHSALHSSPNINSSLSVALKHIWKPIEPYTAYIKWAFLVVLIAAKAYLIFHHEPWRDEAIWLLFLKTESWWKFMIETRGYHFPVYEFCTNAFYTIFGYTITASRIFALVVAVITTYLVLFRLHLPLLISIPLLLGKYLFYEFTVFVNRPYGWSVMLMVIFLYLVVNKKSEIAQMFVLSVLIPGHSLTFIIGSSLALYFVVTREKEFWSKPLNIAVLIYCCCWFGLAVWGLTPHPNEEVFRGDAFQSRSISETFTYFSLIINQGFFSFAPEWMGSYTYLFPASETAFFLSGVVMTTAIVLFFVLLRPEQSAKRIYWATVVGAIIIVIGISSVLTFKYYSTLRGPVGTRHVGMVYVGVLVYACLGYFTLHHRLQSKLPGAKVVLKAIFWFFWGLSSLCMMKTGYEQSVADINRPFVMAYQLADWLRSQGLSTKLYTVYPEYASWAIGLALPEHQYYRGYSNKVNKINDWETSLRNKKMMIPRPPEEQIADCFPPQLMQSKKPLVFLNFNQGVEVTIGGVLYRQVAAFTGAIVWDENYYVYAAVD